VLKRSPATVNNALAAVDDFYMRRGLGPASAARVEIAATAPRALDQRAQLRYLREVQRCPSPRDQALALVPFYAGARISEIVALDVDDVSRSARKGVLRILGKGQRVRHVPIHPQLRAALAGWLVERDDWRGAKDNPALFLNQRGQRLSVRGAHDIVTAIAAAAGLDDNTTVHVYADLRTMPTSVRNSCKRVVSRRTGRHNPGASGMAGSASGGRSMARGRDRPGERSLLRTMRCAGRSAGFDGLVTSRLVVRAPLTAGCVQLPW
jgi:integrase